ncbi:MAG: helix-turn-helix transcriptional regulator [Clostridiales Family XIII bacterium]|jgi:predicted transcriptional regulator|nr:helix-turn-helix transcriptional regulator [Clostridiales Family XIII bacterium]
MTRTKPKTWDQYEKAALAKGAISAEDLRLMDAEIEILHALAEARAECNLSQRDLEKLCGIKQSAISRIETGVHSPEIGTTLRLLAALGKTLKVVPLAEDF